MPGSDFSMTKSAIQKAARNRLLGAMSARDFEHLIPRMEPVSLPFGLILEAPGKPVETIIFVEHGIASRLVVGAQGEMSESGHIGFEGMTGRSVVLGGEHATNQIQMQVSGGGLAIRAADLLEVMRLSVDLHTLMVRYVLTTIAQGDHTLLSTGQYTVAQRLARWLVMYHDRIDGDHFPVTHELLAMMLNVRRAGITTALHLIEGEHAVRSTRGTIKVLDRTALIKLAGGSYGVPEAEYERLIAPHHPEPMDPAPSQDATILQ